MIQKHCYECGTALIEKELAEEGIVPYCPKCQQYHFPIYNVAVSMIVVDEETGKILLIQQYGRPSYIPVAEYVNRGEQTEHAVAREIKEETGLDVTLIRFNRTKFFEPFPVGVASSCKTINRIIPNSFSALSGNKTSNMRVIIVFCCRTLYRCVGRNEAPYVIFDHNNRTLRGCVDHNLK